MDSLIWTSLITVRFDYSKHPWIWKAIYVTASQSSKAKVGQLKTLQAQFIKRSYLLLQFRTQEVPNISWFQNSWSPLLCDLVAGYNFMNSSHIGAFCLFSLCWICYCHFSKSTRKEIGKMHFFGVLKMTSKRNSHQRKRYYMCVNS